MKPDLQYSMMSDEDIILDIAARIDALRIWKRLKDSDVQSAGGVSRQLISDFRNGKRSISLKSLIRILRGMGEVDRLRNLFDEPAEYSPLAPPVSEQVRRVRDRDKPNCRPEDCRL
jgi:transcriptional regulator with XRE-family HTH domain